MRITAAPAGPRFRAGGPALGFPHTSAVRGIDASLRQLRPRQGRCPWRAFYGQIGDTLVIAAIGPEAGVDPKGFTRAIKLATRRLDDIEQED